MSPFDDKDDLLLSAPRKRTRATPEQLVILEKTFDVNPSPNNRVREQLSHELGMSERSIQIWFQNRRAKVKNIAKKSSMMHDETLRMQYYASSAATAACQAAVYHQQQQQGIEPKEMDMSDPMKTNPDLYYYYYYYYFNQQQQQLQRQQQKHYHPYGYHQQSSSSQFHSPTSATSSTSVPPPPLTLKTIPPPPPPPPPTDNRHESMSPTTQAMWSKKQVYQQRARAHTIGPHYAPQQARSTGRIERGASVEMSTHHSNNNSKIPYPISTQFNTQPGLQQESFSHMLHNNSTSLHQPQFSNMSLHDANHPNDFMPTQYFQDAWSNLPFCKFGVIHGKITSHVLIYISIDQDTSMMITPTTPSNMFTPTPAPITTTTPTTLLQPQPSPHTQLISAEALQIGTWKRMGFEPADLICQFDKEKQLFSWCIRDGASKFKMEFHQSSVSKIQLLPLEDKVGWARLQLSVSCGDAISFYMQVTPNWVQCRDYTEDKQASSVSLHYLDGPEVTLKAELDLLAKENTYIDSILVK